MDVSIANRLYEYRKKNNLSQEELADKIGVSRQAVSKWERAEASPDTDNLVLLARLYNVSLDELINSDPKKTDSSNRKNQKTDFVNISPSGIHVVEEDGSEVKVGWKGIHVKDVDEESEVHVDWTGVRVKNAEGERHYNSEDFIGFTKKSFARSFPIALIVVIAYLIIGGVYSYWHPGWLVFFVIPFYYQIVDCINKKSWRSRLNALPVVICTVFAYLYFGLIKGIWHPTWLILMFGPLYHSLVSTFVSGKRIDKDVIDVNVEVKADEDK